MADIAPGSTVNVKIVKTPTNASARKTLVRILSKDAEVIAENKRLKKVRKTNQTHSPRGGRWRVWEGRLPKQHPVEGKLGEAGTVLASPDVLTDLKSVERFVEVSAA
ncbi:MAG: hypothetical protein KTR15_01240 [Phycisphaeraceae bacterium]|nr:hypothetical protein [Phycisphaeraceae bacterium]